MTLAILAAATISIQPMAHPEVLEPSVLNEVEHALARAPKGVPFAKFDFNRGKTAAELAVALVSSQQSDGRWRVGTNDVTFAAVRELKRLAYGDGAFKILSIGNSFSISNCQHMPDVCEALGIEMEFASLYIGGCTLERHWNNVVAATTNATFAPYRLRHLRTGGKGEKRPHASFVVKTSPTAANIPDALKAARWDVVTIQQASHQSWHPESYRPYGDNLVKTIRELAPQAEIVVQETWSYTPFDRRLKKWKITQDEMYEKLHAAYASFAAQYGFRVIPMGTAVQSWRRRLPVVYAADSFGGDVCGGGGGRKIGEKKCDVFHLNERGEYFQSLVWTSAIFKMDITPCSYCPPFVSASDAKLMKDIASSLR